MSDLKITAPAFEAPYLVPKTSDKPDKQDKSVKENPNSEGNNNK